MSAEAHTTDAPEYGIPDDLLRQEAGILAASETWHLPRDEWNPIREITKGEGITIGVGDTGVDTDHPLLPSPIEAESFIRGESIEDRNAHGTHVSGTCLARDNDLGVAPAADLVIAKVLSNSGSGSSAGIARGIRWMADVGCDIISLSLGGPSKYQPTIDAIDYAFSKGVIVCIALGNSGFSGRNSIGWPARSGRGIGVAAMREDGSIANFSSGGSQATIAAPGQNILSTVPGGRLGRMSGTSMATPFTAGCMALVVSQMRRLGHARWTAVEAVKEWIQLNATDRGRPGHDPSFGHGELTMPTIMQKLATGGLRFA